MTSGGGWAVGPALAASLVVSSGCATIVVGTSQHVSITSSPPGATATVLPSGATVVTPADVSLPRKRSHTVRFQLDGYQATNGYIDPVPGGASWGNLLVGGLPGMMVDIDSGAAWTLRPDPLHVVLEPIPAHDEPTVPRSPAESVGDGVPVEP